MNLQKFSEVSFIRKPAVCFYYLEIVKIYYFFLIIDYNPLGSVYIVFWKYYLQLKFEKHSKTTITFWKISSLSFSLFWRALGYFHFNPFHATGLLLHPQKTSEIFGFLMTSSKTNNPLKSNFDKYENWVELKLSFFVNIFCFCYVFLFIYLFLSFEIHNFGNTVLKN